MPTIPAFLPSRPTDALAPAFAVDFDRITRVATRALNVPVAQFNVLTEAEQVSASSVGPGAWQGRRSVPLDVSYCKEVVRTGTALVIDDARTHPLVCDNPATAEAGIGAYIGVPVVVRDGTVAGTLCVVDFVPRTWTSEEQTLLTDLAASIAGAIELARQAADHARARTYLDQVLSASGAHLYVLSVDGEGVARQWASANIEQIAGYRPADTVAPGWWHDAIHPADRERASAAIPSVLAGVTGDALVHEYRLRHRSGHYIWLHDELRLVRDAQGRPLELVGCWIDVSERKATETALQAANDELEAHVAERTAALVRANADLRQEAERRQETEAALERSEAHFRSLIERAPDVISLVDVAGTITYNGPSIERALGHPPSAVLGTNIFASIHPEDRERVQRAFTGLVEQPSSAHRVTCRFRHADETWRMFEAVATNLLDDPSVAAVVINARDVTERVEAAESLRASEERFRATFEQAAVGIASVAPDGRWLRLNARLSRILGYSEEELLPLTFRDITHPEDLTIDLEQRARLLAGEINTYQAEKRYIHKAGHIVWALLTTSVVRDAAGIPDYVIAVIEDITERRRTAEDLRHAKSEMLERLARAAEFRDDDTGQHTRRVGELSARIAAALELPPDEVELIRRAAPLHDVGKIAIPDGILLKPGRLTSDEFEVMKTHARIGAEILSGGKSALMTTAEAIARAHHERWDGGGYPDGLAGAAIPLVARIVAVADFYDALTSDRPYRAAWPRERVLAEIERGMGTHFDPLVASAFLRIAAGLGESWKAAQQRTDASQVEIRV